MNLVSVAIVIVAYSLLVVVGGVIGYVKAKSKASLISGIISGVLLLIAGLMLLQESGIGLVLALVVTAVLVIVFSVRLIKTRKFMPAGLMVAAGIAVLVTLVGFAV